MQLSILICSLNRRVVYLKRLLDILNKQSTDEVEVLVETDDGQMKIGSKRNLLLEKAKGTYVAFVDDDDTVSEDYVKLILEAIKEEPDVIGIHLLHYVDNVLSGKTYHSLKYNRWFNERSKTENVMLYYRCPNHLNPVKKEIALKVKYPDISNGEDKDYSYRLYPLLKVEKYIENPIYNYLERRHKEV